MKLQATLFYLVVPLAAVGLMANSPEDEAAAARAAEKMQSEAGQADRNAMVCKKFPPPVGTRLRARQICKTQAEWDMLEKETYDTLDRIQRKPCVGNPASGACN